MSARPTVLILRTSRFVTRAIDAARQQWPDADIRVAHQPGAESELEGAGIPSDARIVMTTPGRLTLASVALSKWGWQARHWSPDHVVLQWWNAQGTGHAGADRAALWLQPSGFHVVFEDGSRRWQPATDRLLRPLRTAGRRVAGVIAIVAIATAAVVLYLWARWHREAERRRMRTVS